jgi:hypothetical protein
VAQLNNAQLLNAVPNPTSNLTAIYYYVPQTAKSAKIQLSDGNGVVLQTINIPTFGYSSVGIQVGNLSSSIFYYSLIVNDTLIATKKLSVVLK